MKPKVCRKCNKVIQSGEATQVVAKPGGIGYEREHVQCSEAPKQ